MWRRPRDAPAQGPDEDPSRTAAVQRMIRSVLLQPEVTDPRVVEAMRRVPRDAFVPPALKDWAWEDRALDIGHNQTISAPHMVAIMASVLDARPGQRVLEVGTGSGYHAAVLAELVRDGEGRGHVFTLEYVQPLADQARAALESAGYGDLVTVHSGDGSMGLPEEAPFDRISVAAASPEVPAPLEAQLVNGGRMAIPVGPTECELVVVEKTREALHRHKHGRCVFVPLRGRHGSNAPTGVVWDRDQQR